MRKIEVKFAGRKLYAAVLYKTSHFGKPVLVKVRGWSEDKIMAAALNRQERAVATELGRWA